MANIMFAAPLKDLHNAVQKGEIGNLNPTPWAFMLGNCLGWVTYAILKQNLFIFFGNAPGFIMSVWLNLGAVKLLYQKHHSREMRKSVVNLLVDQERRSLNMNSNSLMALRKGLEEQEDEIEGLRALPRLNGESSLNLDDHGPKSSLSWGNPVLDDDENDNDDIHADHGSKPALKWGKLVLDVTSQRTPAPAPHETIVFAMTIMWVTCISIICLVPSITPRNRELIVAWLVISNLIFFYGAPLSTFYTVLKERNSSSIHVPTMITNTLNGTFWSIYGFAVSDMFVAIPNGIGALFGVLQVVLIVLFPRQAKDAHSERTLLEILHRVVLRFRLNWKRRYSRLIEGIAVCYSRLS